MGENFCPAEQKVYIEKYRSNSPSLFPQKQRVARNIFLLNRFCFFLYAPQSSAQLSSEIYIYKIVYNSNLNRINELHICERVRFQMKIYLNRINKLVFDFNI